MVFTTLAHHIDVTFLHEAYRLTRKDGAVGIDGRTAEEYAEHLEDNLLDLHERFKSGKYHAPPVRRVYIPKGDGGERTRPIGIPTFEDKILQRAVAMVLEAVYEQDFMDCSYGFRPKRSAHQALDRLWKSVMDLKDAWVLELDITSYFDSMSHEHLRSFLDQRVRDGVIRRMIDKWLKAGVLEDGNIARSEEGTPQGGVISPILANLYLHEVLDTWFDRMVRPQLHGQASLVRYADDGVLLFSKEFDARRVLEVLPKRFGRYGLTLHPDKTRLLNFSPLDRKGTPHGVSPGSFDFLGFCHFWGRSRQGQPVVKRKTAQSRFTRAVRKIAEWCKQHRHCRVSEQHAALSRKLLGHYAYYGITGNCQALNRFYYEVHRVWRIWLTRRSQHNHMQWERFLRLRCRYRLPPPVVIHSIYSSRRAANPCS